MSTDDDLRARWGSARRPERPSEHPRPPDVDDATVTALGKVSEALEAVEDARGHLYAFHRLSGTADLTLQDGVRELRAAGRDDLADLVDEVLVGRDVIDGRWTFQLVEAYDSQYWAAFREVEAHVRAAAHEGGLEPHVYEAEMKVAEQRDGTLPDG